MTEHSTRTASTRSNNRDENGWRFGIRPSDERSMGEAGMGEAEQSQEGLDGAQMEVEVEQASEQDEELKIREISGRSESVDSEISEISIKSADTARPNIGGTAHNMGAGVQRLEVRVENWKCRYVKSRLYHLEQLLHLVLTFRCYVSPPYLSSNIPMSYSSFPIDLLSLDGSQRILSKLPEDASLHRL